MLRTADLRRSWKSSPCHFSLSQRPPRILRGQFFCTRPTTSPVSDVICEAAVDAVFETPEFDVLVEKVIEAQERAAEDKKAAEKAS